MAYIKRLQHLENMGENKKTAYNFSYLSCSAPVVFGGHLSARAAFRLDRKSPAAYSLKH